MEIFNKLTARQPTGTLSLSAKGGQESGLNLRPGQMLTATVGSVDGNGELRLQINGRTLRVSSDLQLVQGDTLKLTVEQKGANLQLRLLSPNPNTTTSPEQALRQTLPRQQAMDALFTRLSQLATQSAQGASTTATASGDRSTLLSAAQELRNAIANATGQGTVESSSSRATANASPLPVKIQQAINQLLQELPTADKIRTAKGLNQAVSLSGLFMESHILNGPPSATVGDLKSALLRLAAQIRLHSQTTSTPSPSGATLQSTGNEGSKQTQQNTTAQTNVRADMAKLDSGAIIQLLERQTDSALARIQLNQLNSLSNLKQSDEPVFVVELPVFDGKETEMLQLKIRRDRKGRNGETEHDCWSVNLQLGNEEYGKIRGIVTLTGERISTTFWCEREETYAQFQQHLDNLRQRIEDNGLKMDKCQAFNGLPPENTRDIAPTTTNLIDTRA